MCAGKPEKVRTSPFLVAPLWPCVAGGQKGQGCLFRTPFLWFISFGGVITLWKSKNKIKLSNFVLLQVTETNILNGAF
jgi:hypothetical protein